MVIYYFGNVCSNHNFKCGCVEAEEFDTLRARASVLRVNADKVYLLCGFFYLQNMWYRWYNVLKTASGGRVSVFLPCLRSVKWLNIKQIYVEGLSTYCTFFVDWHCYLLKLFA
jgi:hypothetical protein